MEAQRAGGGDRLLTIEEYGRLPDDDLYRDELVRGRVVREPRPGGEHARLTARIAWILQRHVSAHEGGTVLAEGGFVISDSERTVRGADVAFVASERLSPEDVPVGFVSMAPDVAIEIVSPSNSAADIQEKVFEYLDAGTRLVWVVYPTRREVAVYRSREDIRVLTESGALGGEDVLPGLEVPVEELFGTG